MRDSSSKGLRIAAVQGVKLTVVFNVLLSRPAESVSLTCRSHVFPADAGGLGRFARTRLFPAVCRVALPRTTPTSGSRPQPRLNQTYGNSPRSPEASDAASCRSSVACCDDADTTRRSATLGTCVGTVRGSGAVRPAGEPQPSDRLKGGRLLGPMERLLILGLGLGGQLAAATAVIAAKGIIRFPELNSQRHEGDSGINELTEYFLVGSFASWLLALAGVGLA